MSGPWDDYKPTKASSGPWDDYTPQTPTSQVTQPQLPPGVPWKSDNLPTTPSSFLSDALPGPKMHGGDENSSFWQKLKDLDQAGGQATQQFISGLVQPINGLVEDVTGPNFIGNRIRQVEANQANLSDQARTYNENINNAMNVMDPGQIGHGHMEFPAREGIRPRAEAPIEHPITTEKAPWEENWNGNTLANQSELPGGAGAFDNIRRQVAGEIAQSKDITNTPMERMTDTILNGVDQAALQGANQANEHSAVTQYWADRAKELQAEEAGVRDANAADIREHLTQPDDIVQRQMMVDQMGTASDRPTMDALARSTEGITYENVPPDGVIPRDAQRLPNGEPMLRVPRGNEWVKDENGIPVRQGLPESTVAPDYINRYMRQDEGARNDLGNAIQEANGPKLGPDEHYGAGMLEADRPTPPRTYKNSQRGSVDGSLLNDAVQGVKKWFTGSPEAGRTRSYSLEEQAARKNAELQHVGPGQYITQDRDLAGVYGGPNGRAYEVHEPFKQPFDFNTIRDWGNGVKQSGDKLYKQLVDKLGSKTAANAYLKKSGFDAITFTSPRGEKIANVFNPAKLSDIGPAREPIKDFGELSLVPKEIGTPSDKFNVALARAMRGKGSQGGVIDGKLVDAAHDLVQKATKFIGDMATAPFKAVARMLPEDHMSQITGKDYVMRPDPGEDIAKQAVAQGAMDTSLWKNVQSGLALAAEKTGSKALQGVGDWLGWSDKRTHLDNKKMVDPLNKTLKALPQKDFEALHQAMMNEQKTRTLMSDADLQQLSPKAQEAYKALRTAFKQTFDRTNTTLKAAGKEPIKFEEAYHASQRYGDWKSAYYDKNGKLIWYDSSASKLEGMKAMAYLKKQFGDKIDWNRSKGPQFGPDSITANIPRDILGTYREMMKFMDPNDPTTTLISDAIAKYNDEKGTNKVGFNQRFLDKQNVPGFEGNKPWLSPAKNAENFFNGQMKYLRDANHWNNFQEALNNINPILKNEDLIRNQPNIMDVAAAHVQRELGISGNLLAGIEREWAKNFPKVGIVDGKPTVALGISRGNVYKGVADVKAATYLTMLGFNVPYMITTPLQAAMSIAQHRALTLKGYDHNVARTTFKSIQDIAGGLAAHVMHSMAGKDVETGMSPEGKRMLQYARDNGILDKTVMDESGGTRSHAVFEGLKHTAGMTVSAPEKIARWSTFVGFAHHLLDSGKLTEAQAFKMAEDFTNHSLTSMRKSDKPLIVDKLGTGGQLGYVFHSYLFNEYNQLSQFARMASKGNVSPLALHAAMLFTLGGALAMPGINELDSGYSVLKNLIAKFAPKAYINNFWNFNDIGIRGSILRDLPTWASIGSTSEASKTNIGSRFNTQVTDIGNPLGDLAVPIQEGKEIMSLGDFAVDPTMRNAIQALHANSGSTIKGAMETHLDVYKNKTNAPNGRNPDGTQTYIKPSDINNTAADYKRTPEEESRRALGFYGDKEYATKQIRYANNAESERQSQVYDNLMKLAIRAMKDGNEDRSKMFAQKAITLNSDAEKFDKTLTEAITNSGLTPEERDKIHADNIVRLKKVQRAQPN